MNTDSADLQELFKHFIKRTRDIINCSNIRPTQALEIFQIENIRSTKFYQPLLFWYPIRYLSICSMELRNKTIGRCCKRGLPEKSILPPPGNIKPYVIRQFSVAK